MSTIVYQELLHSNYTNNYHSTLSLRLTSTSSNNHNITSSSSCDTKTWGAIEALSSSSFDGHIGFDNEKKSTYVHPQMKKSSMRLSEKSLEMCTESLGNETGVCIMESSLLNIISSNPKPRQKLETTSQNNITTTTTKFPPPLTTMTGSNSIQVRPYREDGRLVIKAVPAASTSRSYLQAERGGGRLRLSFVTETENPSENQVSDDENVIEDGIPSDDQINDRYRNMGARNKTLSDNQVSNYENIIRNEEENEGEGVFFGDEDRNGIKLDLGVKMGIGEFQRLSRCKEGGRGNNKRLVNWEAFWVAT